MTEKEKMISGEYYFCYDEQLTQEREKARILNQRYNQTKDSEKDERTKILKELFNETGPNIEIVPPFQCDYGYNILTGDHFFMNFGGVILDCAHVTIGDHVLCGPYVQIYTATHPVDPEKRKSGAEYALPISIGNNVWLGGGAIVLPGVTIGDNTVIGAGSVVTKNIPAGVVAAGNPCKIIKMINNY